MLKDSYVEMEEILSRFGEAFCIDGRVTQVKLAEALNIRQSSISDAKKRKSIPADWYLKALEINGVDPNWIRTGAGPKHRVLADSPDGALTVTELTRRIVEANRKEMSFEEILQELNKRLPLGASLNIIYPRKKSFAEQYVEASEIVASTAGGL